MNNPFSETHAEYRFPTRDVASQFRADLVGSRDIRTKDSRLRKSLPKFKGLKTGDFSVFVEFFAFSDQVRGAIMYRQSKERNGFKVCPDIGHCRQL